MAREVPEPEKPLAAAQPFPQSLLPEKLCFHTVGQERSYLVKAKAGDAVSESTQARVLLRKRCAEKHASRLQTRGFQHFPTTKCKHV